MSGLDRSDPIYGDQITRDAPKYESDKSDKYGRNHDDNFAETTKYSNLTKDERIFSKKNKKTKKARKFAAAPEQAELHEMTLQGSDFKY